MLKILVKQSNTWKKLSLVSCKREKVVKIFVILANSQILTLSQSTLSSVEKVVTEWAAEIYESSAVTQLVYNSYYQIFGWSLNTDDRRHNDLKIILKPNRYSATYFLIVAFFKVTIRRPFFQI